MEKEIYGIWKPFDDFPDKIWLEKFLLDKNGLKMQFKSHYEKKIIEFNFGYASLSFRVTDEGDLLQSLCDWEKEYGEDFFSWPLHKLNNSSFIKWFHEESCEKFIDENIEHYVFLTGSEIVEVLSLDTPEVVIL